MTMHHRIYISVAACRDEARVRHQKVEKGFHEKFSRIPMAEDKAAIESWLSGINEK